MTELTYRAVGAHPVPFAVAPGLAIELEVDARGARVESILLHVQVRIEAAGRAYSPDEVARLVELFGEPSQWGRSVRSLHWTIATVVVPAFEGSTRVDLHVPVTVELTAATSKMFLALDGGTLPLMLYFRGTTFTRGEDGLRATPIPWSTEARYALPVAVYREAMDLAFPGRAILALDRGVFARLERLKADQGLVSWETMFERLLDRCSP